MSGYVGAEIGGFDTLRKWGLILLADTIIGMPPLKKNLVEIPAADGTINMSYVVTDGEPVYGNRNISFSLFKAVNDDELNEIRAELIALCHGRETTLRLPIDRNHYYKGLFSVGDMKGYHSGTIPISVIAEPYAIKNDPTILNIIIRGSGTESVTVSNEMRPAVPIFTASDDVAITFNNVTYTISAGETAIPQIKLPAGESELILSALPETEVAITYQEARI